MRPMEMERHLGLEEDRMGMCLEERRMGWVALRLEVVHLIGVSQLVGMMELGRR